MISTLFLAAASVLTQDKPAVRHLPLAEYRDRMKAAWVGQIAGVAWAAPTEFKFCHQIIPADQWRPWNPAMIAQAFNQDDLYVEMTFLKTLETYGYGVSQRQAAIDFANSRYHLWHANAEGRNLLRRGIAPPDSANPRLNKCANDIDYQIEADFSGIISPGCPQAAIRLGEKFGGIMNYADGLFGGQFVGALYCAAFFETNLVAVVKEALSAIPAQCRYAEMVRDLLAWHAEDPLDWQKAWAKIDGKYGHSALGNCPEIDVTLNGAMVVLGVLWGGGDPDRTIEIAGRGGFDSDCNPSSAAGVAFTAIGFSKLPARFTSGLDLKTRFSFTDYAIPDLFVVSERLAREVIVAEGGRIVNDPVCGEMFEIPVAPPRASSFATYKSPVPIKNSRFTPSEMEQIRFTPCAWGEKSAPNAASCVRNAP